MRRTSTNLSDGRELIYFDSDATARRTDRTTAVDRRQLEATATASEIRHDALLDEWVVIATHRQGRTHLPPADECPLCPSREGRLTEIPAGDYDVVSFENRFPSFAGVVDTNRPPVDGESRPGLGRCEVLCFTSDHETPMSRLPLDRIRLVLDAWIDRSAELARLPFVEQVFCFENRGEEIGVTLGHPHGQVYGYPFVTPRTRAMADAARRHHERTGGCLLTDRLDAELRDASRLVATSEHWVAFVPFAARWPVQVQIQPRRPVPDLSSLEDAARDDFPGIYSTVLRAMDDLYGSPMPYVSAWYQAPVRGDRDLVPLHLEVFSVKRSAHRIKYLAGSESGMGAFINDLSPERVASMLREARVP